MKKSARIPKRGAASGADQKEQFPKGPEGTRGEKDSAWHARQWFLEQRGLTSEALPGLEEMSAKSDQRKADKINKEQTERDDKMNKVKKSKIQEPVELEFKGGSLGKTFDEVEKHLALEMPLPKDITEAEQALAPTGLSIGIAGVRTSSQAGSQNVFLLTTDALALVIDLYASQDLVNSGRKFDANFQIIEFATNTVKKNQWWKNIAFSWGTNFWISMGNNWGPQPGDYTTPQKWGLTTGLYLFRATVEVQGIGAFSFSNEHVFRVR